MRCAQIQVTVATAFSMLLANPAISHAGVIVGSGSVSAWGRATPYTSWDVLFDPLPGLVDPAEGRVRDFAFHNGRLYATSNHSLQNGGPWYYTPGATGSLAAPIQPAMPFPVGTPWRFVTNGALAINTSGQGFGSFTSADPVLVGIGASPAGGFNPQAYTLTQSAQNYVVGPISNFPSPLGFIPRSLEYVPSLDRFISIGSNQANPAQSTLNFHPHDTAGILPRDSHTTLNISGIRGITPVSAAFASMLSGQSITAPSLLALQKDDLGFSDPPRLYLLSLSGQVITQTDYSIPGWMDPHALAVDEANGFIFTSDRELGQIHVLSVPAPGSAMTSLFVASMLMLSRRRR